MRLNRKKLVCAMLDADLNTKQLAERAGVTRATACSIKMESHVITKQQ